MDGRGAIAVQAAEEQLGGGAPQSRRVLGHHRDARFEQVSQEEIVKADQRNRVVQVEASEGSIGADGEQVLAGESGRRWVRHREQLHHCLLGAVDTAKVETDQSRVDLDRVRRHHVVVSLVAPRGGGDRLQVAQVADSPVALGCRGGAGVVAKPVQLAVQA